MNPLAYRKLLNALGPDLAIVGADSPEHYHRDWTASAAVVPAVVVRPRSTDDVSRTLSLCNELGLPVVPQGGRTGLVRGAMPDPESVVVSLDRMRPEMQLDPIGQRVTVGAGMTLAEVQSLAIENGMSFPVDFGARGSCQIGGMLATNAGGMQVLRYGMIRKQVLGLEAVLADGSVVGSISGLEKNNAGLNLEQLLIGSEGTLGIITRAVLRLVPQDRARCVAMLSVPSVAAAMKVLSRLRQLRLEVNAFEAMWPGYYAYACRVTYDQPLAPHDGLQILIEITGNEDGALFDGLLNALEPLMEDSTVTDAVVAQSEAQADALWEIREANEALTTRYPQIVSFDISLAVRDIEGFVAEWRKSIADIVEGAELICFGHLGDGNLHLAVLSQRRFSASELQETKYVTLSAVGRRGGSISAEHGIGRDKLPYLGLSRTAAEIRAMRSIKAALDPRWILNPDAMLPREMPKSLSEIVFS